MTCPTAIVVGTGAGGATVARDLQGAFDVTMLEAGARFSPMDHSIRSLERIRATGLLFDARATRLVFPHMRILPTQDQLLVYGIGVGGTTTIFTGNALRMDGDLKALGIDLDEEFAALAADIPISTAHLEGWREITRRLYGICQDMGLEPFPTPKMGDYARCRHCGRCIFGCPAGVKWDSRRFVEDALARGARLETNCRVERVAIEDGRATGVWSGRGPRRRFHPADLVVLAAGGLGTAQVLDRSGILAEPHLFVDTVLCVGARLPGYGQPHEVQMPFVVQREGYILSPYTDYLSVFFNRAWRYPADDIVSLMIKIADSEIGEVRAGEVRKTLSERDRDRLEDGVALCVEILGGLGVAPGDAMLGTVNGGHPGGTLPLTEHEAATLHHDRLPTNLYVADASLLPRSMGNPPSLTIMALAKRVARLCHASLGLAVVPTGIDA